MHVLLVVWLTIAMLAWSPPPACSPGGSISICGAETNRYARIAWVALDVAYDPAEKPLFEGPKGRAKTALQLLAIAGFESSYREDVQMGTKRGKAGDACLMQIIPASAGIKKKRMQMTPLMYKWSEPRTEPGPEDITAEALVGPDPHFCFRLGLHIVRESFKICGDLSMYTNGKCNKEIKAKHREQRAFQHYRMHPAPVADIDVPANAGIYNSAVGF